MSNHAFQRQLLRLKETLDIWEEQEIANLLGMSKGAFSARKKRGAFPIDKLRSLMLDRPDLLIDDVYILTGEYKSVEQAKEASEKKEKRRKEERKLNSEALEMVAEKYASYEFEENMMRPITDREVELFMNYRAATDAGKIAIESTARAVEKSTK